MLSNHDSLDDSPFQSACDACTTYKYIDSIDDVSAGTHTAAYACELPTEGHRDSLLDDSTTASACNAFVLHGRERDSLMDQGDPTADILSSNSNSNSGGNACMLPGCNSADTGRHSFEGTRNQDSLMEFCTPKGSCDACMLPNPKTPSAAAQPTSTKVRRALTAAADENATAVATKQTVQLRCGALSECHASGLYSFPRRHVSEVRFSATCSYRFVCNGMVCCQ